MRKQNKKSDKSKGQSTNNSFDKSKDYASPVGESTENYKPKGKGRDKGSGKGKGHPNDLSWYVTDPQILLDAARIPYNIPVGMPFTREGNVATGLFGSYFHDSVPGIAAMEVIPSIGNAQRPNDAVNVAANSIFTFVRSRVNGSRTYDPNDMILYVMAVDAIYYWIAYCTRAYATTTLYHQGNRYLPDALLVASKIDANDLRNNLAQFRQALNQRILKISTLVMPASMPIFRRHSWLFSNYFIEGESIKDQVYLYNPGAYYKFGLDANGAGKLFAAQVRGNNTHLGVGDLLSAQDLIAILDEMIDPIFNDQDFVTISGDFLKAYEGNIMKLGIIPDVLPIGVEFNPEVLLQFKNAKPSNAIRVADSSYHSGYRFRFNNFDIEQDTNKQFLQVKLDPQGFQYVLSPNGSITHTTITDPSCPAWKQRIMQAMWNELSKPIMITSPHATVEPGENMINTRLIACFLAEYDSGNTNSDWTTVLGIEFGSEWPEIVKLFSFHQDKITGTVSLIHRNFLRVMYLDETTDDALQYANSYLPIRSAFKYVPEMAIIVRDSNDQVFSSGRDFFEVDNYALTAYEVITGLHNTAIQGEYNIPRLAIASS